MSKFVHPDITRIRREKEKEKKSKGYPYWVTNCTYNNELNYSYEEKNKVRQTQSR